jgi:hypothetical protein
MRDDPIVPTRRDIDAWRLQAETAIELGDVTRLGQFNWPMVVLSLIQEWEKNNAGK